MTLRERHVEEVRKRDERLRRKAQRIVEATVLAARLDDDGHPVDGTAVDERGVPVGMTPVEWNVAKDARRPQKLQPGYLALMGKVLDGYKRGDTVDREPPALGADIRVYLTQNVYNYPTRDVSDKGEGK